jgi:V/A-type H+-transporting ATPase subunit D
MPRLSLRKSELLRQREQLKTYRALLPSLDLKRRQLMMELAKARKDLAESERALDAILSKVGEDLPMLAAVRGDLSQLVRLTSLRLEQQNVAGVRLPVVAEARFEVSEVSLLASPVWMDELEKRLREAAMAKSTAVVASRRVTMLERTARKITQRLNLFERVLIPETQANIRQIQVALGDAERDAVIRSKLSKGRQVAQREAWAREMV